MYYEERVINGVLCCRSSPNDDFRPMSIQALTAKVVILEGNLRCADNELFSMKYRMSNLEEAVEHFLERA